MDDENSICKISETAFWDLLNRGVQPHGYCLLALLKATFQEEARKGGVFEISTPKMATDNFIQGWNRDRYVRAIQNLLETGDLQKITPRQPRFCGRFAPVRYRFGNCETFFVPKSQNSIWIDVKSRYLN